MVNDKKVKDAKNRESEFHEKVYEDMKSKLKKSEEDVVEENVESKASGSGDVEAGARTKRKQVEEEDVLPDEKRK